MLVDITPKSLEQLRQQFRGSDDEISDLVRHWMPERIGLGMYAGSWNPDGFFVETLKDPEWPGPRRLTPEELALSKDERMEVERHIWAEFWAEDRRYTRAMRKLYSQKYKQNWFGEPGGFGVGYGVCDYPQQLFERYPHYRDDDVARAAFFVEVRREDQTECGGWRYHKWGKYIGKQRPRHEYLYDDTHIDAVWTFSLKLISAPSSSG